MIPRPLGCDGNDCDYDVGGWFHIDCELATSALGASVIRHFTMTRTRRHFEASPMPQQQNRRSA